MQDNKLYTLGQAQAILHQQFMDKLDEGDHCPNCLQWAKRYRRPLTSAMAYGLVLVGNELVRKKEEWLHVENFLKNYPGIPSSIRGDFAKLVHWRLVEKAWGKRPDGSSRNGFYRVTARGYDFIHGRIAVESHAILYNGECQGLTGQHVHIKQALGKEFDYNEIMHDHKLPADPQPAPPPGQLFDTSSLEVRPRHVDMG